MNWETDLHRLQSCKGSAHSARADSEQPEWLQDIPQIEDTATFDVILGSDVLYEVRFCCIHSPGNAWLSSVCPLAHDECSMHSLTAGATSHIELKGWLCSTRMMKVVRTAARLL